MGLKIEKGKNDDYHLWQSLKSGDQSAFDQVFRANYEALYNYGLKVTFDEAIAKDCIQEVFIGIWENKENLADIKVIKAYLFKSYRRKLINYIQLQQKKDSIEQLDEIAYGISFSQEDFLIQQQTKDNLSIKLAEHMNGLPERQKEAMFLKYYGGFTNEEISDILQMNRQSVANLLSRAFISLKKKLTQNCQ